ncbi:MAG TPA: LptF/LptG family permease, partial [Oculatellaceae cyanobacterium]
MSTAPLKLVDRYIFKQLLDYFLLGLVIFTLVAFFSDTLLKFIREIQKYGLPFATLLTLVGLQLPKSIALVIPPSCFFAVLMVFSQLNSQFEIIAMRMNGISLWRLMRPALLLGLLCAALTYTLNDYMVPWCNQRTAEMKEEVIRSGTLPPHGNSFMFRTFDDQHNLVQMIYVAHYKGRQLGDTTIIDLSKPKVMQLVQAQSGMWDPRNGWVLNNANVYLVSEDTRHSSAGHVGVYRSVGLVKNQKSEEKRREELQEKASGIRIKSEQMTFSQMMEAIQKREQLNKRVARSHYLSM